MSNNMNDTNLGHRGLAVAYDDDINFYDTVPYDDSGMSQMGDYRRLKFLPKKEDLYEKVCIPYDNDRECEFCYLPTEEVYGNASNSRSSMMVVDRCRGNYSPGYVNTTRINGTYVRRSQRLLKGTLKNHGNGTGDPLPCQCNSHSYQCNGDCGKVPVVCCNGKNNNTHQTTESGEVKDKNFCIKDSNLNQFVPRIRRGGVCDSLNSPLGNTFIQRGVKRENQCYREVNRSDDIFKDKDGRLYTMTRMYHDDKCLNSFNKTDNVKQNPYARTSVSDDAFNNEREGEVVLSNSAMEVEGGQKLSHAKDLQCSTLHFSPSMCGDSVHGKHYEYEGNINDNTNSDVLYGSDEDDIVHIRKKYRGSIHDSYMSSDVKDLTCNDNIPPRRQSMRLNGSSNVVNSILLSNMKHDILVEKLSEISNVLGQISTGLKLQNTVQTSIVSRKSEDEEIESLRGKDKSSSCDIAGISRGLDSYLDATKLSKPKNDDDVIFSSSRNVFINPKDSLFPSDKVIKVNTLGKLPRQKGLVGSIVDYPFVYEFGKGKKYSESRSPIQRWQHCEYIYVVWQGPQQVGAAKHLEHMHYQRRVDLLLVDVERYLSTGSDGNATFVLIGSRACYDDNNLFVSHYGKKSSEIISLKSVKDVLSKVKKKKGGDDLRQREYFDIGFTTTRCSAHGEGCPLGITRPRKFRGTVQSKVIFEQTYKLLKCVSSSKIMENFKMSSERINDFAHQLHKHNIFEAARVHCTSADSTSESVCKEHGDKKNSKLGCLRSVVWWSALVMKDGRVSRVGLVCYFRSSIDSYYQRRKVHSCYLKLCKEVLKNPEHVPQSRITFIGKDFDKESIIEEFSFLPLKKGRCNFMLESYYQPFVACLYSFLHKYKRIHRYELLSVLLAIGRTLSSPVHTCIAMRLLLSKNFNVKVDKGWYLIKLFAKIDKVHSQYEIKVPLRMGKYETFTIPDASGDTWNQRQWREAVLKVGTEIDRFNKSEKITTAEYDRLHHHIIGNIPSIGELFSNHVIGIASLIGIVPLSAYPMVTGGANKFIEIIEDVFINQQLPLKDVILENV